MVDVAQNTGKHRNRCCWIVLTKLSQKESSKRQLHEKICSKGVEKYVLEVPYDAKHIGRDLTPPFPIHMLSGAQFSPDTPSNGIEKRWQ